MIMRKLVGTIILIFMLLVVPMFTAISAPPPPPNPGGGPGKNDVWIGGTPIAGGFLILVALAAGYGARKFYNVRKRKISE